jgi:hypothetical protein
MLITLTLPTLYQRYRKVEEFEDFDVGRVSGVERKNRKKEKINKTCVYRGRYRSGVSPYLASAGWFVRPDGRRSPWKQLYRKPP